MPGTAQDRDERQPHDRDRGVDRRRRRPSAYGDQADHADHADHAEHAEHADHADEVAQFEHVHAQLGAVTADGVAPPTNDGGSIGWGTAWVMHAYLLMFEATGDPTYLHRLSRVADWVLGQRDHERGTSDFRGTSAPAWSSTGSFTVATASVNGPSGADAMLVRVCPPGSATASVEVAPGSVAGTVTVVVTADGDARDTLPDLSLDPRHPRYAPHVAYAAYPGRTRVTIEVPVAGSDGSPELPVAGRYRCVPARVTLAAQTGMITYPMAELVRVLRATPGIGGPVLAAKVDHYLEQVVAALSGHEEQWRLDAEGRGHYVWLRDEPVSFAGVELPTNEFLTMGRAHAAVAAVTADGPHRERGVAIARTLRGQLRRRRGTVVWSYWPSFGHVHRGWSKTGSSETDVSPFRPQFAAQPKLEDVTHALIDTDFAASFHRADWLPPVFSDADMSAFARTYLRRVAFRRVPGLPAEPAIRRDVSGRGRRAGPHQQLHAAAWLAFSPWQTAIRPHVTQVLTGATVDGDPVRGVDAYCAALLAHSAAATRGSRQGG